ncbi:SGNH/GDSL hydrolase family protein [Pedobacter sp. SD-b]|uniref:SGNH/GDSL hydrolase family protein n=2 Tax=Pedobacter segetis TaxID=2793069 RepID=A0ABS1BL61_9SPHI|nr:SGNH/GDSL hydrolase family protein [Pedobacter segetis]
MSFSSSAASKKLSDHFLYSEKTDSGYLSNIILELQKTWPQNRTINLVFHGHSVPSGYQHTPIVTTFGSYPLLSLWLITQKYPHAVVNAIKTSIGGENAEQGAKRFKRDVLSKQPDVIFIDYALNDRPIGLQRAKAAWESMIQEALDANVKLVLMTPTPDIKEDIKDPNAPLALHTRQIIELGEKYHIPVIDSYDAFKKMALEGVDLKIYMAQNNHINPKGHQVVADLIYKLFIK